MSLKGQLSFYLSITQNASESLRLISDPENQKPSWEGRGDQQFFIICVSQEKICFYFMCKSVELARISVLRVCAWCLRRPEEGARSPGAAVTGGSDPPEMWCEELSPGPLHAYHGFSATESEGQWSMPGSSPIAICLHRTLRCQFGRTG